MMKKAIRRILVAVDPSKTRDTAFDQALGLARGWNAELYLIHTRPPRPVSRFAGSGGDLELERSEGERSQLGALVRSAQDQDVQVQVVTAQGNDPARAIAAHAHLVPADLIVMSRDFGSSRVWRRSRVAAAAGRAAPVPVLIVPPQKPAPYRGGTPFKRIVVAVDFTVASAVALRVAADLIAQNGGQGTAVHALSHASPMALSGGEALGVIEDWRHRTLRGEARLRRAIPAVASHLVMPRVVAGDAGQAILDVAAEMYADLVVMGVPSRNRLGEVLFGSTFRKVVSRSVRPILAIPVAAGAHPWAGNAPALSLNDQRHLRTAA